MVRMKVNSPEGSDAPARPNCGGSVGWGARRRWLLTAPKGGRPPKGAPPPGGVCGPKGSGPCPLTGKSASAASSSGSPARNAKARAGDFCLFSRLNTSIPLRPSLAAALRKAAVVLFDRLAVAAGRRALVAEPQVGAAELLAQTLAQLKLKLSQGVDDLRLERSGRQRLALHAPVGHAAQLFDGAAEFPARRAAQLAAQVLRIAQALAQLRAELPSVVCAGARYHVAAATAAPAARLLPGLLRGLLPRLLL